MTDIVFCSTVPPLGAVQYGIKNYIFAIASNIKVLPN